MRRPGGGGGGGGGQIWVGQGRTMFAQTTLSQG